VQNAPFLIRAMPNPAITIENLGKRYTIDHRRANRDGRRDGLSHAIEGVIRSPRAWFRSGRQEKMQHADFWALKDVSFQIETGDVVGIIGSNGAGKSTLLKILSRITIPTEGRFRMDGRSASLLEVGTGFHQELTGRENIFLNGAILGMARAEISRKFDEIVEFSGVEEFLDTPVKRYSSGMYVRLAFAVAAHLEPEILIVDEVLAVGDSAFQRKCLGKMQSIGQSGRTVLFVSHNAEAVRSLCQRCIWLKGGRLHKDGKTHEIIDTYLNSTKKSPTSGANTDHGLTIQRVVLKNGRGEETSEFRPGEDLIVEIDYNAQKRLDQPSVELGVHGSIGCCFTADMSLDGHRPEILAGSGKLACWFKSLPLTPQGYSVRMSVQTKDLDDTMIRYQDVAYFSVVGDLAEYGFKGEYRSRASQTCAVVVPYEWYLPDGTIAAVSLAYPRPYNDPCNVGSSRTNST
jgi:lipopolysaccharide transport system ATP-binding protein